MNEEQDRASYYQEHKDDPELWGDPERPEPVVSRKRLGATITVRFSAEEADRIRVMARQSGLSYSEVVREAVKHFGQPSITLQVGSANRLIESVPSGNTEQHIHISGRLRAAARPQTVNAGAARATTLPDVE